MASRVTCPGPSRSPRAFPRRRLQFPTQLYETLALLPLAWMLLRWRREGRSDAFVLGAYFTSAGVIRFGIESLRVHQPILGPLALAHLLSVAAAFVGVVLLSQSRGPVGR